MSWNARLRATWHGEVPSADLVAMFAATARLTGLQQELEDRRLAARIDNVGHDWRVVLAVGAIAAPLWLADALAGLAGAFYDAEISSHPDRQSSVRAYVHDLVTTLLAPVEDLIAEVTASLADPARGPILQAALRIGLGGDIVGDELPDPPFLAYVQGLSTGVIRLQTSAATTLLDVRKEVTQSPAPDWLTAGLARLDGVLQAAGARQEMCTERLESLVATHTSDPAALESLSRELWMVVESSIQAGQVLADPHLMPEAATAGASRHLSPAPTAPLPPFATRPPKPAPPSPVESITLPEIDPGVAPLRQDHETPVQPPSSSSSASPWPEFSLPIIGKASTPTGQPLTPPGQSLHQGQRPNPVAGEDEDKEEPKPFKFPDIGS
jgi:hypothetical protein